MKDGVPAKDEAGLWWIDDEQQPTCFSLYWTNQEGEEGDLCRECLFAKLCSDEFLKVTLPKAEKKLGLGATTAQLAAALNVTEPDVLFAQSERKARGIAAPKLKRRPTRAGSAKSAAGPAKSRAPKKAPPKAKAKQAAKPKAKAPASKKKKPSVQTAAAPASKTGEKLSRWERERNRSKAIAALTPGTVLKTTYKGEEYQCKVLKGAYQYQGEEYPTLYAVTAAAIGTVARPKQVQGSHRPEGERHTCNYSAAKFWKLNKKS
jgi:hypothetical protein